MDPPLFEAELFVNLDDKTSSNVPLADIAPPFAALLFMNKELTIFEFAVIAEVFAM